MVRSISRTATFGLAALLTCRADAGQFSISPLRLDLSAAATTSALTVRNEEAATVVVQAQALDWSQEGGQDALSPTRDLLLSPAVFTLAPGGSQLVRIALRHPPEATRELAYRVALQEVPQPAAPGFTGLQVALRLSVPLFVAATAGAAPQLQWSARMHDDGRLEVVARNDGQGHARIRQFTVKSEDGATTLYEQPVLAYVLPGASRQWVLKAAPDHKSDEPSRAKARGPGQASMPARARLEGTTDQGAFAAELELAVH
jgi:fimbrial chaperone protein